MSAFQRNLFQKKLREAEGSLGLNFNEDGGESDTIKLSSSSSKSSLPNQSPAALHLKTDSAKYPLWSDYFAKNEKYINSTSGITVNTYYTPPTTSTSPIFVCHHGAGSSALTFALLSKELKGMMREDPKENKGDEAGLFCFDARGHGLTEVDEEHKSDFSVDSFINDFEWVTREFLLKNNITSNPVYLLGHSLGGSVITKASYRMRDMKQIKGLIMIDIVEETAIRSLNGMSQYLSTLPRSFCSLDEAIEWHVKSGLVRNQASAEISIPSLFRFNDSTNRYEWRLDLRITQPFWPQWFVSLSSQFTSAPFAKLLVLAGSDSLDKDLMIGQMQGKYQLVVLQESGHFVQEDCASRLGWTLVDFWQRNSGSSGSLEIKSNWGKKHM